MIKGNLVVVGAFDLHCKVADKKPLSLEWEPTDLKSDVIEAYRKSDMMVALDEVGNMKILKNRWGSHGVIVSEETLKDLLAAKKELEKLKNEKHQLDNSPKKKSLLARIFGPHTWSFNRS